jgi:hypothetical protein
MQNRLDQLSVAGVQAGIAVTSGPNPENFALVRLQAAAQARQARATICAAQDFSTFELDTQASHHHGVCRSRLLEQDLPPM